MYPRGYICIHYIMHFYFLIKFNCDQISYYCNIVVAVFADNTETATPVVFVEHQKPCETITFRPANSNFDNGEGNLIYVV